MKFNKRTYKYYDCHLEKGEKYRVYYINYSGEIEFEKYIEGHVTSIKKHGDSYSYGFHVEMENKNYWIALWNYMCGQHGYYDITNQNFLKM